MKKLVIAAVVAIASQAFAEPLPYKPAKAFLSAREIFGLDRRDTDVYHPKQSICGVAATCSEACGTSFAQCASTDNQMHCYDSGANEACCPDGTGNSCQAGYYCAADSAGQTVCCPEGSDLATCASTYSVAGGLHFETKTPTSTVSSTSSASASSSTSSSSLTSAPASATGGVFFETGNSTSASAASGTGAGGSGSATKTTGAAGSSAASATGSTTNGADTASPAGVLALFGAAALAAFL
ncbi:hypothetical protein J7T55_014579 [Diaporthe amygdali]|uniref:uncharacterized protein n=1 Tax=Phomopsis amygdali TaxID=1214568 RepID=UPI0022FEF249|nr:uncharacterized protein J7T55_014579 [Diaporthe amygdali]KAJ0118126.1 hypothetical protein J7T55_014579 [Diaporthe amygdali]